LRKTERGEKGAFRKKKAPTGGKEGKTLFPHQRGGERKRGLWGGAPNQLCMWRVKKKLSPGNHLKRKKISPQEETFVCQGGGGGGLKRDLWEKVCRESKRGFGCRTRGARHLWERRRSRERNTPRTSSRCNGGGKPGGLPRQKTWFLSGQKKKS